MPIVLVMSLSMHSSTMNTPIKQDAGADIRNASVPYKAVLCVKRCLLKGLGHVKAGLAPFKVYA